MTTTARTPGQFWKSVRDQLASDGITHSANGRHTAGIREQLMSAAGQSNEERLCSILADGLHDGTLGIYEDALMKAYLEDWLATGLLSGGTAIQTAALWVSDAVLQFGHDISDARRETIKKWLVDNRATLGSGYTTLTDTFDDCTVAPQTGNMIAKVGDNSPRELRSSRNEALTFDAPTATDPVLVIENRMILSSESGATTFLLFTLPEPPVVAGKVVSYVLAHFAMWKHNRYNAEGQLVHSFRKGAAIATTDTTGKMVTNAEISAAGVDANKPAPNRGAGEVSVSFSGVYTELKRVEVDAPAEEE